MIQKFIVVDDYATNNILCSIIIEDVFPNADIMTFTDPAEALKHIQSAYKDATNMLADTLLFLDINMPLINAWQFLETYATFDEQVKRSIEIHIFSSTIDSRDVELAENNKYVRSFLGKPLTEEIVKTLATK